MKLIVGLGNPGPEYINTRHNIGFKIVEKIAQELDLVFKRQRVVNCSLAKDSKREVVLVKPLAFMNLSGEVVSRLVKKFKIKLQNLLVVYDDVDLGLGRIKFSFAAGSGGHKGLESIIDNIRTKDFARLRFGISGERFDISEYVLSKFKKEELNLVAEAIDKATQASLFWLEFGIKKAMDRYNITNFTNQN